MKLGVNSAPRLLRASSILALLCALNGSGQSQENWTPEHVLRTKTVGSVTPSPEGRWVAYTQTWAVVEEEKSEMLTHIFLATSDGSHEFQLTRGDKGASSPSFSRDGEWVFFTSNRTGKRNIWRIPVRGGEAEQVTDWKGSLGQYEVSPDGKWVAFTGREADPDAEKAKKEKRDFRVVEDPKPNSLWTIPVEKNDAGERPEKKVFEAPYHVTGFRWAPDSSKIAFQHAKTAADEHRFHKDLSEVDLATGEVRELAATPSNESDPHYSPDGRLLAFLKSSDPPRWAQDGRINIIDLADGNIRDLPAMHDEGGQGTNLLGWSEDASLIYFTETDGTQQVARAMPLEGSPRTVYKPSSGTFSGGANLSSTGVHLGFAQESPDTPPEAYLLDVSSKHPVRVSSANQDLALPPLGKTEVVRWESPDGLEIEGLLTYPVGYEKGKKYPLVLFVHGGPMSVFTETFIGGGSRFYRILYPTAPFSSKGFAVLSPNPRGSSGYGRKFRFANLDDWGGGDYRDLIAGVDHMISQGVADPERLAVMGWSYGGYMTSWIVTQTRRFRAAVVGAGVTNLWSFTGTSDIPNFLPEFFSGEPWDNFEAYRDHSPMAFVKGVRTPTLILHGDEDSRVPISQGREFYNALKRQGVTTEMVTYPRMGHGISEPKFGLDVARRQVEWITRFTK